jgi:hypothetical protein
MTIAPILGASLVAIAIAFTVSLESFDVAVWRVFALLPVVSFLTGTVALMPRTAWMRRHLQARFALSRADAQHLATVFFSRTADLRYRRRSAARRADLELALAHGITRFPDELVEPSFQRADEVEALAFATLQSSCFVGLLTATLLTAFQRDLHLAVPRVDPWLFFVVLYTMIFVLAPALAWLAFQFILRFRLQREMKLNAAAASTLCRSFFRFPTFVSEVGEERREELARALRT